MKRFLILFLVLFPLVLCSCAADAEERLIQVSLVETDDYSVEENGQWIAAGKNVSFSLRLTPGCSLIGTDYTGEYRITRENGAVRLELFHVRYPARVELEITRYYRDIRYEANGGSLPDSRDSGRTVTYDISIHSRPNTSNGKELFFRDGYTLVCWNTRPDGSGLRVGLGSRVTVPEEGLTLYAQWCQWTKPEAFSYTTEGDMVTITGYRGSNDTVVVPAVIDGAQVTAVASGAFVNCAAASVVLPGTLQSVEPGAFQNCALECLTVFDNIESIWDAAFMNCSQLKTLYINAAEDPYGYSYRRESVYADKVDLLINAQGRKKAVFYGGCSMWYNLDGEKAQRALGAEYQVINMGLNGTCSSIVQMRILENYLEEGDILFHTPELCSTQQLLTYRDMSAENDDKLWSGLEYNYDLFALVDIRGMNGVFDSFCAYLSMKEPGGTYSRQYRDSDGAVYLDSTGSLPLVRTEQMERLGDKVYLDTDYFADGLSALQTEYERCVEKGALVYLSFACVNLDAVPEKQRDNVQAVNLRFRQIIDEMGGITVVSTLWDYLYENSDFYDTNYHLLSASASRNTDAWLRDLKAQMIRDGILTNT